MNFKPFNESMEPIVADFSASTTGYHGDVIVEQVKELPSNFSTMKLLPDGLLALGEAHGHCHKLFGDFELREDGETKVKYLRLLSPTTLKHQEHGPVVLPPGTYKIGIQKEYDHFEKRIREVAD